MCVGGDRTPLLAMRHAACLLVLLSGTDALYRARWQSLLSVDDMVEGVTAKVEAMGETRKTYFVFSSDHGVLPRPRCTPTL